MEISRIPYSIKGVPRGTRILFPESLDIRVLRATIALSVVGIITPVLIGDKNRILGIEGLSDSDRETLQNIEIIPLDTSYQDTLAIRYNEKKGVSLEAAKRLFPADLAHAAGLYKKGDVSGVVSGSIATTADVIRTGYYGLGLEEGKRISGEFLMYPTERSPSNQIYTIGDCAVCPTSRSDELVAIAYSLVETHRTFHPGIPPRIAFLSYSTYASGTGAGVDLIRDAVTIFREKYPDIECDGPLQWDAVTRREVYDSKTKGQGSLTDFPNILVFPDLNSGNIGYKMMEWSGYQAIGPILTGFAYRGWSDLSRSTTAQTIELMAYVTAMRSSIFHT